MGVAKLHLRDFYLPDQEELFMCDSMLVAFLDRHPFLPRKKQNKKCCCPPAEVLYEETQNWNPDPDV